MCFLYDRLAEIAFDTSDWDLARKAAIKSLSIANKFKDNWHYGNVIHDSNCILGRLALHNGDVRQANYYLNRAAKTKGSPQLNSFGPNMRLAQELLRAGEQKTVINYLKACKGFWEKHSQILSKCIKEIHKGKSLQLPRVL